MLLSRNKTPITLRETLSRDCFLFVFALRRAGRRLRAVAGDRLGRRVEGDALFVGAFLAGFLTGVFR
ncbi:MAG: hypothetical protein ACI9J2_001856 [Saprospiraceae bacterium]|jgi:hypothetical protein